MPHQEILKNYTQIESEGIFNDWSPFNAPVDTGTQNFLICSYYLHAYIHAIIQKGVSESIFKYLYYYLL